MRESLPDRTRQRTSRESTPNFSKVINRTETQLYLCKSVFICGYFF